MQTIRVLIWAVAFVVHAAQAMEIPEAQSADAKLYARTCSLCHALPHPKRLDWPRWRGMLAVMQKRAEERGVEIPADAWRRIAAYLRRHARR